MSDAIREALPKLGYGNATFCPECGPHVDVDNDGTCSLCGATAQGDGVRKLYAALASEPEGPTKLSDVLGPNDTLPTWDDPGGSTAAEPEGPRGEPATDSIIVRLKDIEDADTVAGRALAAGCSERTRLLSIAALCFDVPWNQRYEVAAAFLAMDEVARIETNCVVYLGGAARAPEPEGERIEDFIAWMEDQPGVSWEATLRDAQAYLADLRKSRLKPTDSEEPRDG